MSAAVAPAADALLLELALRLSRRPPRDPDETSQRILREAVHLFGTRGYAGTSLRDIADAVGIRPPSIYTHFASKERLLWAALAETLDDFHAFILEAVEAGRPADAQLAAVVRQHVRWQLGLLRVAGSWDVLWEMERGAGNLAPAHRDAIVERRRGYHVVVEALVATVRPDLDAPRRARAILELCDRSPAWAPLAAAGDEDVVERAWETIACLVR